MTAFSLFSTERLCSLWKVYHDRMHFESDLIHEDHFHGMQMVEEVLERRHPAEFADWLEAREDGRYDAYETPFNFFFLATLEA